MSDGAKIELIELGIADAATLSSLHADAFPKGDAWTQSVIADLLRLDTTSCFGAMAQECLVSFMIAQIGADQAEILTIATSPRHQKLGYAQQLLVQSELHFQAKGAQKWLLDVAADNVGARVFYEKLGFVEDGRRPQYYKRLEGERVDAILMSRPMGGQGTR